MLRNILIYGVIGGLIVAVPMVVSMTVLMGDAHGPYGSSVFIGYAMMVLALSMVFVGVKQHRDKTLGGVIKFLPAFGMGLAISAIAGAFYCAGWELATAITHLDFIDTYSKAEIGKLEAKGAPPAEIEAMRKMLADYAAMYANPVIRVAMIFFMEFFPVGLIVSLIVAALLRNSRFMPARAAG